MTDEENNYYLTLNDDCHEKINNNGALVGSSGSLISARAVSVFPIDLFVHGSIDSP